jgi:acetyl-CoA C-acetyltransferase
MLSAQAIRAGDGDLFIAGGFESMSRAPYLVSGRMGELKFGNTQMTDALLNDGLWDPFENWGMGNAAEFIADEYEVTREAMDKFAFESHQKAVAAQEAGKFKDEIVPVEVPGRKGQVTVVEQDEGPRKETTLEALSKLKPVFKSDGKVTAGNASSMNDGAAAVVVASRAYAEKKNLKPIARISRATRSSGRAKISVRCACICHAEVVEENRLDVGGCGLDRVERSLRRASAGGRLRARR